MRGLFLSKGLEKYLSQPMRADVRFPLTDRAQQRITRTRQALLRRRDRFDPLFTLLREWANSERTPVAHERWEYEGELLFEQLVTQRPKWRRALFASIKELSAIIVYKQTVNELVTLATLGDDESLMKLIELDKMFLTAAFAQKRIRQAQAMEDKRFFQHLSKTLHLDTFRDHQDEVVLGVACYLLWFLGFQNLPKQRLFEFLSAEGLVPYSDPQSFNRKLSRIGLRRYRKLGHPTG